jgi:hypothetical protein
MVLYNWCSKNAVLGIICARVCFSFVDIPDLWIWRRLSRYNSLGYHSENAWEAGHLRGRPMYLDGCSMTWMSWNLDAKDKEGGSRYIGSRNN